MIELKNEAAIKEIAALTGTTPENINHAISIYAESSGSAFQNAPAGNHVARCYSMIYMGTILESFKGESKKLKKVRLSWELPNEQMNDGRPFIISKDFTLSFNEKSTLRKFLESWRGKQFTEKEAKKFDICRLIGVPCQLQIIHKTSAKGNTYADIANVSTLLKGVTAPEQVNQTVAFSIESFDKNVFDSFPDYLKTKIMSSEEYSKINPAVFSEVSTIDDLPF